MLVENADPRGEQTQFAPPPQHIAGPWQFRLPETLCRMPGLSANHRVSTFQKNAAVQGVRDAVTLTLRSLINRGRMPARFERIRVEVEWHAQGRRKRDRDNLAPLCKAIFDAVGSDRGTGVHLVPDDDDAHMDKPQARIIPDSGDPGFVVRITNLGDIR